MRMIQLLHMLSHTMPELSRSHIDEPVPEYSEMFREDTTRYPGAPCSHCGQPQRKGSRTVWVRPFCHTAHQYVRAPKDGGSISILCVGCATRLYGYNKRKGLT